MVHDADRETEGKSLGRPGSGGIMLPEATEDYGHGETRILPQTFWEEHGSADTADFCPQNPEITNACCLQPAGCAVLLLQSSETKANFTCAKSLQSCLTLCDPVDHSPPGSSVHGILQARILEWIVMPSFRGSSHPRVELGAPAPPALVDEFFTTSVTWGAQPHSGCLIYEMHCVRACMPTC